MSDLEALWLLSQPFRPAFIVQAVMGDSSKNRHDCGTRIPLIKTNLSDLAYSGSLLCVACVSWVACVKRAWESSLLIKKHGLSDPCPVCPPPLLILVQLTLF